jgi:1-phosphofructokinase family hexose kinase
MIATVTLNPSLDEWVTLPALRLGRLNRASRVERYPGGKGINVSRVVHELGGRTVAFALAGGEDGAILSHRMHGLRIQHEFVTVAGSTRNNYKILTAGGVLTEINTAGPHAPASALRALRRRLLRRPLPRCVVLSGSLPPGVPASIYRDVIRSFRRLSVPAVLDASGAALRLGLSARPWLIKPNREEAEELLGRRLSTMDAVVDAVRALLRRGPHAAILSLGKAGAVLGALAPDGVWLARPPAVTVRSAVGAGDSLVGGVVTAWRRGATLLDAFRWGMACGSASAMTPGTELCRRRDVERLLPRVTIRRVG